MKKKLLLSLIAVLVALPLPALAATTLSFEVPSTITAGSTFNVPVKISTTENIQAIMLDITTSDVTVSKITSALSGNFFSSPDWYSPPSPTGSSINIQVYNTDFSTETGAGTIATLTLSAGLAGSTTLSIAATTKIFDAEGDEVLDYTSTPATAIVSSGPTATATANVTRGVLDEENKIPIEFTGIVIGGTAPYNHTWKFGDGEIQHTKGTLSLDDADIVIHNYTAPGTYFINYSVIDSRGLMANKTFEIKIIPPGRMSAQIFKPADGDRLEVGKRYKFLANVSGTTITNLTYVWDLGIKLAPWGTMKLDKNEIEACYKANKTTASCSGLENIDYEGTFDPNEPGNPCKCRSAVNESLYPSAMKNYKEFYYTYTELESCATWSDPENKKCTIELTVTNTTGATASDEITIKVKGPGEPELEEAPVTCPVNSQACSANETDSILGTSCCCRSGYDLAANKSKCIVSAAPTPTTLTPITPTCGNSICESGEAATCQQDCHCGNGICDKVWAENSANCPTDCPKQPITIYVIIALAIALAFLFLFAWQRGYLSGIFGGKTPEEEFPPTLSGLAEKHGIEEGEGSISKVKAYISECREQGFSYTQIKAALKRKGWDEETINRAFGE